MLITDTRKKRRLNIMISADLVEWAATTAEIKGMSMSAFVRQALVREYEQAHELSLAKAADALAPLYASSKELTAFTALDGDDFG